MSEYKVVQAKILSSTTKISLYGKRYTQIALRDLTDRSLIYDNLVSPEDTLETSMPRAQYLLMRHAEYDNSRKNRRVTLVLKLRCSPDYINRWEVHEVHPPMPVWRERTARTLDAIESMLDHLAQGCLVASSYLRKWEIAK